MRKIDFKKAFGNTVRGWRNRRGISQEELGERADLHRTYVCDVERGARNVSLESIEKLAHALDVSVSALFPATEFPIGKTGIGRGNGQGRDCVDILLVEDNPDDVELTLRAFKKSRLTNRVQVVQDGAEALDYLFCRGNYSQRRVENRPQVVLLDLNLPKVKGMEVLRRIKAEKETRMIPVIILTVSQDDGDMEECRRLGAETYIVKPVDFKKLSETTPQLNLNWVLIKPSKAGPQNKNG